MASETLLQDSVLTNKRKTQIYLLKYVKPLVTKCRPFQVVLVIKNLHASAGDVRNIGSIPELGRSPGGVHGNPLSILAWRTSWTKEPGGLYYLSLQRVRHD